MPEDLSAKFGLASGLLGLAMECTRSGAFKWAATLLEVSTWIISPEKRLITFILSYLKFGIVGSIRSSKKLHLFSWISLFYLEVAWGYPGNYLEAAQNILLLLLY